LFDRMLLAPTRAPRARLARLAARRGWGAYALTIAGFGVGMLALPVLALGGSGIGLALILVNRLLDGLDGAVARLTKPTDRGAFLDIALDFFFYATVPFAFALYDPAANALAAAFLILAFVGTGSSFLAFSVIAAKRGLANVDYPGKGLYFLGGLTEGAETIAFFCLICLWPAAFAPLAVLFGIACCITTGFRWYWGWKTFAEPANLP
jgi:phosphatidylglycerophosphate synthase